MYIITILFSEAPTETEQAEIQALFGDKYAPESTDTIYVYVTSKNKDDAAKTLLASTIRPKIYDLHISGTFCVVNTDPVPPPLAEAVATASSTDGKAQEESTPE